MTIPAPIRPRKAAAGVGAVHPGWPVPGRATRQDVAHGLLTHLLSPPRRWRSWPDSARSSPPSSRRPPAPPPRSRPSSARRRSPPGPAPSSGPLYDATTNDYHLVVSRNGAAPQRLAVAPSANAFDVDLGTNRSGSTYAVYSRCTTPATENTVPTGCDLYRLSIASGIETKLDTLSSPTWDEREPTIYRGEIAFIRDETHGGRNEDVLRIGNTTSGAQGTTALVVRNRLGGSLQDPELARAGWRTSSPTATGPSATSMSAR